MFFRLWKVRRYYSEVELVQGPLPVRGDVGAVAAVSQFKFLQCHKKRRDILPWCPPWTRERKAGPTTSLWIGNASVEIWSSTPDHDKPWCKWMFFMLCHLTWIGKICHSCQLILVSWWNLPSSYTKLLEHPIKQEWSLWTSIPWIFLLAAFLWKKWPSRYLIWSNFVF